MASDGDNDDRKLRGKLASGGTQCCNVSYLFPLSPCCKESNHALRDTSASGNNGSIVNELIGSEFKNEECADERRDAIRDNLAVHHVALRLCTCEREGKELRCKWRA